MKTPARKNAAKPTAINPRAATAHAAVENVFAGYPSPVKSKLLALRKLIFATAKTTSGVGKLEETLKWGSRAI